MRKLFILTACLGLVACAQTPEDRVHDTCFNALDGVYIYSRWAECVKRVSDAEYEARHRAVQPYRDIPRVRN
jgi:hypothetical protein